MYEVVLVDPDKTRIDNLKKIIDWEKYECRVVGETTCGEEAKDLLGKIMPDMLILDVDLKDCDGIRVVSVVKNILPNMEITILTSNREFLTAKKAVNLGVSSYLIKPAKVEDINMAIKKMIAKLEGRTYIGRHTQFSNELKNNNNSYILNEAISYIEKNYNKKLTLQTVADEIYISVWHLSKMINRNLGMGYNDILNEIRVEKAKKYLKNPEYRVYEVAEKVGIPDVTYFSKTFKKYAGVTPNQYRNMYDKLKNED